jgi:hypothetical protein
MTIQGWINWHRTIGFIATIFILFLVVSGLALNHAGDLKLDRKYIENEMILDWYGIAPQRAPVSYQAGSHRVTQIDNRLYLDEDEIQDNPEVLRGVVSSGQFMALAFSSSIYLITGQGDLIEKITREQGLPADLHAIGLGRDGEILIRSGHTVFYSDTDMQTWRQYPYSGGYWSGSDKLPGNLERTLIRKYRGKGLSLEKLLLDLHSGRIFGGAGVYLIDLSAIIFIILAVSGWWLWLKRRALQKKINSSL